MTKTIKAEYLPGGAKRQEMLDQVQLILRTPGATQTNMILFELSKAYRDRIS